MSKILGPYKLVKSVEYAIGTDMGVLDGEPPGSATWRLPVGAEAGADLIVRNRGAGAISLRSCGSDTVNGTYSVEVAVGSCVRVTYDGRGTWKASVVVDGRWENLWGTTAGDSEPRGRTCEGSVLPTGGVLDGVDSHARIPVDGYYLSKKYTRIMSVDPTITGKGMIYLPMGVEGTELTVKNCTERAIVVGPRTGQQLDRQTSGSVTLEPTDSCIMWCVNSLEWESM
jgi:hypothetical protein